MKQRRNIDLTDIASLFLVVYYTWYCLPFMRATFQGGLYKYLFFGFFAVGAALLAVARLQHNGLSIAFQPWRSILVPIIPYMLIMLLLSVLKIGDATKHIRVSFTFWGTGIIYYLISFDKKLQVRFGKFLLLLFAVTAVTSSIGVVIDSSAARAIANASQREDAVARDYVLMRKNISGVYLFQSLVVLSPAAIMMMRYRRKPLWGAVVLVAIVVITLKASFAIACFLLILGCGLALISNRRVPVAVICTFGLLLILLLPMDSILTFLAGVIPNHYISARLGELAVFWGQRSIQGDFQLRVQSYLYSIRTFLQHPLGVGPWYTYVIGAHGIGFHSEILDDLARYGLTAVVFYGVFLREYGHLLKVQWAKINFQCVVFPVVTVYVLFLMTNIAFRSADESIFMLYILPSLPDIWIQNKKSLIKKKGAQR